MPKEKKNPESKIKTHLSADLGNIRMKWEPGRGRWLGCLVVEVHDGRAWHEACGGEGEGRLLLAAIFRLGNAVADLQRRLGGHDLTLLRPDDDFGLAESALKSFERHVSEARQRSATRKPTTAEETAAAGARIRVAQLTAGKPAARQVRRLRTAAQKTVARRMSRSQQAEARRRYAGRRLQLPH